MLLVRWDPGIISTIPRGILFIAFLQLPFVLHEYLFLVPKRMGMGGGIVPVDVVSGSFGGSLYGGGANAVLAVFLITVVACVAGVWKHQAMPGKRAAVLSALFLAPLLVNEVKVTVLYLPLLFIVLFYRYIVERPVRFLAAGAATGALLVVLMTAFTLHHQNTKHVQSWSDLVSYVFEKQTADVSERGANYNELTRWTTLTFWVGEHFPGSAAHIFVGHGPGASRVQEAGLDLAETLAEKRYGGMKIGTTAVSALLWDTGVIGLMSVLGMFFAAFRAARKLSVYYQERDPFKSGIYDGLSAAVAVLTLSLAHKDFFVYHLPFQTIVILMFSFIVLGQRQIESAPVSARYPSLSG